VRAFVLDGSLRSLDPSASLGAGSRGGCPHIIHYSLRVLNS
jgi:hypothetical protein